MPERFDPAKIVERDGDIISGADAESLEQNLPGALGEPEDPYEEAIRVARTFPDFSVVVGEEGEDTQISAAEKAYEAAYARVQTREDQGIDRSVAWANIDPSGLIRKKYEAEKEAKEAEVNTAGAKATRDIGVQSRQNAVANNPSERLHLQALLVVEEKRRHPRS